MASRKIAGTLPQPPPSLKSVSPYVQRAEELRSKDPVMAYWCTYYAAQVGLDQKSHESGARDYLLTLITLLEDMKKDLGANDAVDNEAAGAAYVENFALKVFALADNEDRRGEATRSTAKKFLAAANFLELLRVFEKSNNAEVNNEKVRYAKWKASDIAKAFREGRKPTPGSADNEIPEDVLTPSAIEASSVRTSVRTFDDLSPGGSTPPAPSTETDMSRTMPSKLKNTPDAFPAEPSSPSNWSTVATPGSEGVGPASSSAKLAFTSAVNRWKGQNDADMTSTSSGIGQSNDFNDGTLLRGTVNDVPTSSIPVDIPLRKVHFTPSVVGGLSSRNGPSPVSPDSGYADPINTTAISSISSAAQPSYGFGSSSLGKTDPKMTPLPDSSSSSSSRASLEESPPPNSRGQLRDSSTGGIAIKQSDSPADAVGSQRGYSPDSARLPSQPSVAPPTGSRGHERQRRRSSVSSQTSPFQISNPHLNPAHPSSHFPTTSSVLSSSTYGHPPHNHVRPNGSPEQISEPGLPPTASSQPPYKPYGANYDLSVPSHKGQHLEPIPSSLRPLELTPLLIAKAQKHCRYAISSLEYEDAEQARKELRAALAVLGER
ncbi:DUF605-domain-containing protein [Phellopilus nigrolimitatus]|nr:DUF605-domain-containing protein [Phellopilus nigrolimitatus]